MQNPINEDLDRFARVHVSASIHNRHDAEDVLQDIRVMLLVLFKKYPDKTPEELDKIARTACRNRVRDFIRYKRRPQVELPEVYARIDLKQMDARHQIEDIRRSCNPKTSSMLYYLAKGMDRGEIESIFQVSRSTVHRCLKEAKEVANAVHTRKSS